MCSVMINQQITSLSRCINEFMDLTGATTRDGRARNYGQELVLPISPFDPKFTYRADVMKQGTAMMYVKDADLIEVISVVT